MNGEKGYFTIGVAGHVDHGKTSLVRGLTGIETDRMKEEKQRGLSIESGVAVFPSDNSVSIALVDVPGHTDFLKNTIRGLSCVDFAILVVAADDGVMPQTLEHVQILDLFGVDDGLIVLSKTDLVDRETLEIAELEIRDTLKNTFLGDKAIYHYSNTDQRGLDRIRDAILNTAHSIPHKDPNLPFRMWIDRVKKSRGFGTVISGTVLSGVVKKDDPLVLMPEGKETRARSLESHHKQITEATAGQRIGVSLHKITLDDIKRGMAVACPGTLRASNFLNAFLRVLKNRRKSVRNRQKVMLYTGTCLIKATIVIMEKEFLKPGEGGFIQLRFSDPIAVLPEDSFIITPMNIPEILGGGKIIEIARKKFRNINASETVTSQQALIKKDVSGYIDVQTMVNNNSLIKAEDLAKDTGLSLNELKCELRRRVSQGEFLEFGEKGVLKVDSYKKVKSDLPDLFKKIQEKNPLKHKINLEEIKNRLPFTFPDEPLERILRELSNEGVLVYEDGGYLLSGFTPDLSEEQSYMVSFIFKFAAENGMTPFSPDSVWKKNKFKYPKKKINRVFSFLRSRKKLIQVNDGRFLTPETMEQIKSVLSDFILDNEIFTLADCQPVLGYGRTVAIPILEYLDKEGFTVRVENGRILME